jgi:uncharacterized protein (DUF1810 family)
MKDTYNLQRFVNSQNAVYDTVISELETGKKETHWMWFIFPQLKGLGGSPKSQYYGISDLREAWDYLKHPVLGPRLEECVLTADASSCVFDAVDQKKWVSSLSLFALASLSEPPPNIYLEILRRSGGFDKGTLEILQR